MEDWEKKLNYILKGIDKDVSQDEKAWWDTPYGAEFGAAKLREVKEFIKNLLAEKFSG